MEILNSETVSYIKRCRDCARAYTLVSFALVVNEPDDSDVKISYSQPFPIGQTRECFDLLPRWLSGNGKSRHTKYILPEEDDACINPRRFKPKTP